MGKRGPAKKPAELEALEGNPGRRPRNTKAPKVKGAPVEPDYLDDYGLRVWRRLVGAMPAGVYRATDSDLLAAYCEAAALHRRAATMIRIEGEIAVGEKGTPFQNPWVAILNRQAQLLATLGTRLGLDPAARQALNADPDEDAPPSKFEGLFAIPGGRTA